MLLDWVVLVTISVLLFVGLYFVSTSIREQNQKKGWFCGVLALTIVIIYMVFFRVRNESFMTWAYMYPIIISGIMAFGDLVTSDEKHTFAKIYGSISLLLMILLFF